MVNLRRDPPAQWTAARSKDLCWELQEISRCLPSVLIRWPEASPRPRPTIGRCREGAPQAIHFATNGRFRECRIAASGIVEWQLWAGRSRNRRVFVRRSHRTRIGGGLARRITPPVFVRQRFFSRYAGAFASAMLARHRAQVVQGGCSDAGECSVSLQQLRPPVRG